ncbi:MAG: hypothetical protein RI973_2019 [Bacteroidota bacterium]
MQLYKKCLTSALNKLIGDTAKLPAKDSGGLPQEWGVISSKYPVLAFFRTAFQGKYLPFMAT